MRSLREKLWAKTVALGLAVLTAMLCCFCLLSTVYMARQQLYSDGGSAARQRICGGSSFDKMCRLLEDYVQACYWQETGVEAGLDHYREQFLPEVSNFYFSLQAEDGSLTLENPAAEESAYRKSLSFTVLRDPGWEEIRADFQTVQERWQYIEQCQRSYRELSYELWDADTDGDGDFECGVDLRGLSGTPVTITADCGVRAGLSAPDDFYTAIHRLELALRLRYALPLLGGICLLLLLVLTAFLLSGAGYREGEDGISLTWAERIPAEFVLLAMAAAALAVLQLADSAYGEERVAAFVLGTGVMSLLGLLCAMNLAARMKAGRFWEHTLLGLFFRGLSALRDFFLRELPGHWQLMLGWLGLCGAELLAVLLFGPDRLLLLWILEKLLLTPLLLLAAANFRRLRRHSRAIAAGRLDARWEPEGMLPPLRSYGEDLSRIEEGLRTAVEARTKSERLKTELITNVSHDIKTPLTSIVNYVDLLKREGLDSPGAADYLAVLDRQSQRLKKLTEDLVEASKASSGNVTVETERVDLRLLLEQARGEYADRLAARQLETLVLERSPVAPVTADGRLLWRVLDNLLSNVCKYAQTGTRVYLELSQEDGWVQTAVKNVSAAPLNISPDELMERFVRGDRSRSSEGSGLGLSIARSLTELQGGSFSLEIDGDLFKAMLRFPAAG